ncbi:YjeF N-terminal domain-like protein [Tilletiaria anomala UBC 951]|uniref:NAD(P)H-hydrate epimerase n=1 Tax=Tilletiaria anomala (strain ATCC 24038 / CBS 436.72 / UBC 951) TaxID=1037660 RepID=A0A066WEC4_TILAU|nr:YjeF N-terminal domain-like protein [Tilletiaria anomala UBC 951]KDN52297.1 YjeF N-terminal domain-like protein [Tilletiaria anomala UBC 951]
MGSVAEGSLQPSEQAQELPPSSPSSASPPRIRFIDAAEAASIDEKLMSAEGGFSIDQLMELAGLACAQTVYACYPPDQFPSVLVAAGPGNQGGDGLVAARHLHHFGYDVKVCYPKQGKTDLFARLKRQLQNLKITIVGADDFEDAYEQTDVMLDCIFGFSFKGEVRQPFKDIIGLWKNDSLVEFEFRRHQPPIVSVDIPSAWDVEKGNVNGSFTPQVLLSLSAPKLGSAAFGGRHFLGGRFIPDELEREMDLLLPDFEADSQIVEITGAHPLDRKAVEELRASKE